MVSFPIFTQEDQAKAIIGLVVNLFFPGIGTIICACMSRGGTHTPTLVVGILQALLYYGSIIVGSVLFWTYVAMLLYFLAPVGWIWALIWGILIIVNVGKVPVPQQVTVITTTPMGEGVPQPVYYAPPVAAPVGAAPVYYAAPVAGNPVPSGEQQPTSFNPPPAADQPQYDSAIFSTQPNVPEGFFVAGQAPQPSAEPPQGTEQNPPPSQ